MIVPANIRTRIEADVKKYVAMAEKHFRRTYPAIRIQYDVRGTVAGYAEGSTLVRFNPVLLMENLEDYLARTVPHEVAHCIDSANGDNSRPAWHMRNGRRLKRSIHGPTWQRIMQVLGVDDITRCHSYDTTNARTKTKRKFEYKCTSCTKSLFVSSVLHNRILQGREYWCRKCGRGHGKLQYVQNLGQRTYEDARKVSEARQQGMNQAMQKLGAAVYPQQVAPPPAAPPQAQSMMDRARECYKTYRGVSRQEMIDIFVRRLGMKATTASTYYNSLKD